MLEGRGHGEDYEVIVIGARVDLGLRATVLDANSSLGGTWYNNRYPGARFDSESYTDGYSFSEEVLNEWHWSQHFSPQDVSEAAEQAWFAAVESSYDGLLLNKAQSWITGYTSNLDGHEYGHTRDNIFATGGAAYAKHLRAAAASNYEAINFSQRD